MSIEGSEGLVQLGIENFGNLGISGILGRELEHPLRTIKASIIKVSLFMFIEQYKI
jgi:hypothetical protein